MITKITQKSVQECIKLGFEKAFIDADGDLIAHFPNQDKVFIARDTYDGFVKAWVVVGEYPMWTPKSITVEVRGGHKFVSLFKTVKEAARLALAGPHY